MRSSFKKKVENAAIASSPISKFRQPPTVKPPTVTPPTVTPGHPGFNAPVKYRVSDVDPYDPRVSDQHLGDFPTYIRGSNTRLHGQPQDTIPMCRNRLFDLREATYNYINHPDNIRDRKNVIILGTINGQLRKFTMSVGPINKGYDNETEDRWHLRAGDGYLSIKTRKGKLSIMLFATLSTRGAKQHASDHIHKAEYAPDTGVEDDLKYLLAFITNIRPYMDEYYRNNTTGYRETNYTCT
jgi:hypothetical protein